MKISRWFVENISFHKKKTAFFLIIVSALSFYISTAVDIVLPETVNNNNFIYITIDSDIVLDEVRVLNRIDEIKKDILTTVPEIDYSHSILNYLGNKETVLKEVPESIFSMDRKQTVMIFNSEKEYSEESLQNLVKLFNSTEYRSFKTIEHFSVYLSGASVRNYREKVFFENEVITLTIFSLIIIVIIFGIVNRSYTAAIALLLSFITSLSLSFAGVRIVTPVLNPYFAFMFFLTTAFCLTVVISTFNHYFKRKYIVTDDRKEACAFALSKTYRRIGILYLFFIVVNVVTVIFLPGEKTAVAGFLAGFLPGLLFSIISTIFLFLDGISLGRYKQNNMPDKLKTDPFFEVGSAFCSRKSFLLIIFSVVVSFLLIIIVNYKVEKNYNAPFHNYEKISKNETGIFYSMSLTLEGNTLSKEKALAEIKSSLIQNNNLQRVIFLPDFESIRESQDTYIFVFKTIPLNDVSTLDKVISDIKKKNGNLQILYALDNTSLLNYYNNLPSEFLYLFVTTAIVFLIMVIFIKSTYCSRHCSQVLKKTVVTFYQIKKVRVLKGALISCRRSLKKLSAIIFILLIFAASISSVFLIVGNISLLTLYVILLPLVVLLQYYFSFRNSLSDNMMKMKNFDEAFIYTYKTECVIQLTVFFSIAVGSAALKWSVHPDFQNAAKVLLVINILFALISTIIVPAFIYQMKEEYNFEKKDLNAFQNYMMEKLNVPDKYNNPFEKDTNYKYIENEYNHFVKKMAVMSLSIILFFVLLFAASTLYNIFKDIF